MSNKKNFDFTNFVNNVVDKAKDLTANLTEKSESFAIESGLQDLKDFYPFYSWPPLNLYSSEDKSLIFEFGLSGFIKDDIKIEFNEDYMIFSAILSNKYSTGGKDRIYKNKLKLKDIKNQKYFVPVGRFDRKNFTMHMKNGLLRVVFPPVVKEYLALEK